MNVRPMELMSETRPSLSEAFKAAFRRLASGVCVITFRQDGRLYGFTATSVTSISANPPMLSFCVSNRSNSFSCMRVGLPIGVSILSSHQRAIAERFAQKSLPEGYGDIPASEHEGGTPVLPGALAAVSGKITTITPAGDNIVLFCEIEAASSSIAGEPLLYGNGQYLRTLTA